MCINHDVVSCMETWCSHVSIVLPIFQEYLGTKHAWALSYLKIDRAIINFLFHQTACSLVNGRHAAQIQIIYNMMDSKAPKNTCIF